MSLTFDDLVIVKINPPKFMWCQLQRYPFLNSSSSQTFLSNVKAQMSLSGRQITYCKQSFPIAGNFCSEELHNTAKEMLCL